MGRGPCSFTVVFLESRGLRDARRGPTTDVTVGGLAAGQAARKGMTMCQGHAAQIHADPDSPSFADRFLEMLNGGALVLMISIGHRTGLFDAMASLDHATSAQIADRAGLSERYVREWLGAMTAGRVVQHDASRGTYRLPPDHAAFLTRAASPQNLAITAQWLAVLGGVESRVADAFRHGKGVPYEAYERFHEVMADESAQTVVAGLRDHILPLADGLDAALRRGIRVLDVGCGRGMALAQLAEWYPRSQFEGVDMSSEAVADGNEAARRAGLANLRLHRGDAAEWSAGPYDAVLAFDAIHDQARPAAVLANIRRLLAPGGLFLMQDIRARSAHADNLDHPLGPFLYTISCMHCMSVSLAYGGPGLGAAWGRELALKMLADAGFKGVTVHELPHDIINDYYVMRVR